MGNLKSIFVLSLFILFQNAYAFQDNRFVIKGRVTGDDGNPLAGAGISIEGSYTGVYSDADGSYLLANIKGGSYNIRFSFIGYSTIVKEVKLSGATVLDVTLLQEPLMTSEVVVSATRAGERSPLAYTTIDQSVIRKENQGHDIPYLLSLTPSLVETSESGNGVGYTSLRIRGTDASRINVTIDGIPLNDPESQQAFWVDVPDIASSADNIQVQRGAGTSSNGAGAFGATISIQTNDAEIEPFAEINSSAGSFNTFKNTMSVGTGIVAERFAFRFRYSDLKSDGYIDRTGSNHNSAYFSGSYRTDKTRIKANIILGNEHTGIGWWGVPGEVLDTDRRYNPSGEYTGENGVICHYENESDNYKQHHYQLFLSRIFNKYTTLNSALYYTRGKGYYEEYKEDETLSDYSLPDITISETTISVSDIIRRKWMRNNFTGLVYSLKYVKQKIDATIGGGLSYFDGDHFGRIIWMQYAADTDYDYQWYLSNGKKWDFNIYGKLNYAVSKKVTLFGDIQYRYISYNISGIDDDLKDISQEHDFNFFNPKAGIFYSIDPAQDIYFSFSVANREPTRSDYKEAAGDDEATPRPETLYDTELGYKLRYGRSSIGVNLYAMVYDDQLVPTGQLSSTGYSIMTNVDRSYRIGSEISAGLVTCDFFKCNMGLTLSCNKILDFVEYYTDYNTSDWTEEYKSKDLGSVDIAYSPSVIGSGDFDFRVFRNTHLHLISKYVGKQYFDNTMSSDRMIDPYFVTNFRIDFEPVLPFIKNTEIQLFVNNIFNTEYENNAYGGNWREDGIEQTWSYFFPQAGTNFTLRVGLSF